MVVGRCIWGETDQDEDTVEIYRIFDAPEFGPMRMKNPVAMRKKVIPQQTVNRVTLFSEKTVDEIRIGPTLHSVMTGTKPLKVE